MLAIRTSTHATCAIGLLAESAQPAKFERCRELTDAYRAAGGSGSCVLIRRAWLGDAPRGNLDAQLDVYRGYTSAAAQDKWGTDELAGGDESNEVVDALHDSAVRAGADAVNLRVHVPGVTPEMAREQIERLGDEVVASLRARLA